ncbi:hypothetical protein ACP4OV_004463 [Aristida adscensionis]
MALKQPVTIKFSDTGRNARLEYAASAMQGYRVNMEDAHVCIPELCATTATSFFAVYDGHGGPAVAKYCAKHLHVELLRHAEFEGNLPHAAQRTFLRMDEMMRQMNAGKELSSYGGTKYWKKYRRDRLIGSFIPWVQPVYPGPRDDGCTACVALIRGNQIIVANAGDSRCVISKNGQATALSIDHKPGLPAESQRILNAGHEVVLSTRGNFHRIDDGIAIARSIGDLSYKDNETLPPEEQAVTAFPEVQFDEITHDAEFLIIACDGIWDVMTNQEVVDFVHVYLSTGADMHRICESLLDYCVAQPRGRDNMSVVLVMFKNQPPPPPPQQVQQQPQDPPPPQATTQEQAQTQSSSGDLGAGTSHIDDSEIHLAGEAAF